MKCYYFILTTVLLMCCLQGLTGCRTTAGKAARTSWVDFYSAQEAGPAATDCDARLGKDLTALGILSDEMDALMGEMTVLKRRLLFKDCDYLSAEDDQAIALLLFRFINARDELSDLSNHYRSAVLQGEHDRTKGAVLGMSAELKCSCYSSRFVALFMGEGNLIKQMNAAHPSFEIPDGVYEAVFKSATSLDHLERLEVGWYLFSQELERPDSSLAVLRASHADYRAVIEQLDALHASTHIQIAYVLQLHHSPFPEMRNRLRHSRIAKLSDEVTGGLGNGLYKTRGVVFRDVSRLKNPRAHLLQFSPEQVEQIKALLEPGDVLLTYSAGYMSNVFLPGNFKHGITYIGSVEQRRKAGLTDEVIRARAVDTVQGQRMLSDVKIHEQDGYPIDVIEAVAEGVILNSLEKLLATHVNRLVVIRPNFNHEERLGQLVELFKYRGTPYDFKFNFQDDRYQCCTELVYRTTNTKGLIDFDLVKMRGMWILGADQILQYYLSQNPAAFELILLADHPADPKDLRANIQTGRAGLDALYDLMNVERP